MADRVSRRQDANTGSVIRSGSMEGYCNLLLEHGVDPLPILALADLDETVIANTDTIISTRAYRAALNLGAERTAMRHFGLFLSQRQTFEKLGAVGYLVRHAPNLRASIDRLVRHFRTHDTGSLTNLEFDGSSAIWMHRLTGVEDDSAVQQTELAIGLGCRFIRSTLGDSWAPRAVYFEHKAPRDMAPFQAVFRCPVHFDQTVTGIEFLVSDLDLPLRLSDAGLFSILDKYVTYIGEQSTEDCTAMVHRAIQENIEGGRLQIDEVATQLGLRRHVLQRRLKAEGTTFQSILDDVRYELGRRHLRETKTPISEIAGALGYAESAVFTRAFTRRSGMAPQAWRRAHTID